jgi:hypothetical protein
MSIKILAKTLQQLFHKAGPEASWGCSQHWEVPSLKSEGKLLICCRRFCYDHEDDDDNPQKQKRQDTPSSQTQSQTKPFKSWQAKNKAVS